MLLIYHHVDFYLLYQTARRGKRCACLRNSPAQGDLKMRRRGGKPSFVHLPYKQSVGRYHLLRARNVLLEHALPGLADVAREEHVPDSGRDCTDLVGRRVARARELEPASRAVACLHPKHSEHQSGSIASIEKNKRRGCRRDKRGISAIPLSHLWVSWTERMNLASGYAARSSLVRPS